MQQTAFRKTPQGLPAALALAGGLAGALLRVPACLFAVMVCWQHQAEERARLRKLTDIQLHDIGLTRIEVEVMARKPVWSRCV
ncbi:DUF1127 domain-containing protein [Pelagibius sp. CAU 1746]|uniref:DUF1127 domain-containing protein n=1 Tax=Pelagibius sp. CAU 1746 TaxID=3140370 RepID=UPI00325AABC9